MKAFRLLKRLEPLVQKLRGKLPLCPWPAVLTALDPRLLSAYPPRMRIEEIERSGPRRKLRFNGKHEAWFPISAEISPEMWSEYLGVFWEHRANAHRYLAHGSSIRAGDVCLDCGACEGFFAMQALAAGASQVICIEPNPEMADCLRLTFAAEIGEGKIVVRNVGVGAIDGQASFSSNQISPFGGTVEISSDTQTVIKLETVSRICTELAMERIDFIKMDIEGAELQAVDGALPILRRDHPTLAITTYHRSFHYAALKIFLKAAGYRRIRPAGVTDRGGKIFRPMLVHARI